jgi:hypothetical protein
MERQLRNVEALPEQVELAALRSNGDPGAPGDTADEADAPTG